MKSPLPVRYANFKGGEEFPAGHNAAMAPSDEISPTFSYVEATCIVTTSAEGPTPVVSSLPTESEARPVASTLEELPPSPAVSASSETYLGLTLRDCLLLLVLAIACLGLSLWHWGQLSGWGMTEVEVERLPERVYDYRIDMNEATWVEWMQLPGIGQTLAQRIIEHREEHGPFESVDDLDEIRGIGPKTIEKLRPWLIVPEQSAPNPVDD